LLVKLSYLLSFIQTFHLLWLFPNGPGFIV